MKTKYTQKECPKCKGQGKVFMAYGDRKGIVDWVSGSISEYICTVCKGRGTITIMEVDDGC